MPIRPFLSTASGRTHQSKEQQQKEERGAAEAARPHWIVLPRFERGAAAPVAPLSRARAFMQLAEHAFNCDIHGRRGFELLAQVIAASDCFEFQYGALDDAVALFDDVARRA